MRVSPKEIARLHEQMSKPSHRGFVALLWYELEMTFPVQSKTTLTAARCSREFIIDLYKETRTL